MTRQEAIQEFNQTILKGIKASEKANGMKDMPLRRQSWNDFIDLLCKSSRITSKQYHKWEQPSSCL